MARKNISQEKIINAFLFCAFEKSAGATSMADIADYLGIKKASLYNHFESRELMYERTLKYCKRTMSSFTFLPEKYITLDLFEKNDICSIFNTLIKRFIQYYEAEPFFQIFTFVQTEKYFNRFASEIIDDVIFSIELGVSQILLRYCVEKKLGYTPAEIDYAVKIYSSALFEQIDLYIMHKKEIVRQNPECGAGSLFALPTDDDAVSKIFFISENFIRCMFCKVSL